jgi:alkaline phosphatase D
LDPGIARQWLPLFDQYEVDLVMSGHNAGYERSFPVRGFDQDGAATGIFRFRPVTTADSGVFDTSQGTVHLVLGSGGARAASGQDAAWSARRDTSSGHGIAVLDVDPGREADGRTSITVTYYRATDAGPGNPALESAADLPPGDGHGVPGDYAEYESFTLIRPRSDKRRWHARKSPAAVQA